MRSDATILHPVNALQEQWNSAEGPEARLRVLAVGGKKAAVRSNRELAQLYKEARVGLWPFCVSQAMVASTHARSHPGWIPAASKFLRSGDREELIPARGFTQSFGADTLQRALTSFRTLGEFTGIAANSKCDASGLVAAQTKAVQYTMKKEAPGLGAWLFCAPYALMALIRPSLWEDPRLDGLLLPLGSPLARGFGLLQAAGLADVEEALLRDSEPGIRNGLTLLYIARGAEEKLSTQAHTRTLFIHYGIQELGQVRTREKELQACTKGLSG